MLRNLFCLKTRAALAVVAALTAAAAFVDAPAPAAAHGMHGMFLHHSFGGFHHDFHRRFAFAGFGYAPGYAYDDYADYGDCFRRVWGPYGWRLTDVCR
jgi:hypothetical protein